MTISLTLLPAPVLRHLLAGDLASASAALGLPLPAAYLDDAWLWEMRLAQIEADPDAARWLVHAVVNADGVVVGHAGFHGPPDADGMVEGGYTVVPEHRGNGFAKAALGELINLASARGARTFRATVAPTNLASLAVIAPYGLVHVGEQIDEVDGLELIYELPLQQV